MFTKLSATAMVLMLAVPALAQTTATISTDTKADTTATATPCAEQTGTTQKAADGTAGASDSGVVCAPGTASLGTKITPVAKSDDESGKDGDNEEGED